jgi:hypothetical protein
MFEQELRMSPELVRVLAQFQGIAVLGTVSKKSTTETEKEGWPKNYYE